jgi:hypothetical protein
MRVLGWVAAVLFMIASSATLAQQVPCSDVPVALRLPGFEFQCEKLSVTSAELEKAGPEMSRKGMSAAFIEVVFPSDADTYTLLYSQLAKSGQPNKQWGMIALSISHQGHSLSAIALRQLITGFFQDWMYGSKIELDWVSAGKHEGYETQSYIEAISNDVLPIGGKRSCFAFVQHRQQSSAGRYGQRLWGYDCRDGDRVIDDAVVASVLSAISVR